MATNLRYQTFSLPSTIDPNDALTVTSSISRLLAFASKALPLLIYGSIPADNGHKQAIAVRNDLLGITASLYMIQREIALNLDIRHPNISIPLKPYSVDTSLGKRNVLSLSCVHRALQSQRLLLWSQPPTGW
jgi:hypothetical protein